MIQQFINFVKTIKHDWNKQKRRAEIQPAYTITLNSIYSITPFSNVSTYSQSSP